MGTYPFSQFKTELKFELFNRTDLDSYVGKWINTAYYDLVTRDRFEELVLNQLMVFPQLRDSASMLSSDGVAYIPCPANLHFPITLYDETNNTKLNNIPYREYIKKTDRMDTDCEDAPTLWTRAGTSIYLYPTPDATYTIRLYYYKVPPELSAETDKTIIGSEWDEPILKLAVWQSLMRLKDYEKAAIEKQEWLAALGARLGAWKKDELDRKEHFRPDYAYLQGFEYR